MLLSEIPLYILHFLKEKRPSPRRVLKIALLAFILVFFLQSIKNTTLFRRFVGSQLFGGDEPKYLRMLDSLAMSASLDLSSYFGTAEEVEIAIDENLASGTRRFLDLYVIGVNRGIYCLHMPGISAFVLPAYFFDLRIFPNQPENAPEALKFLPHKLYFTRLFLLVIAVLTILLLFRLLDHLIRSLILASVLVLLFIVNSPYPSNALMMYPSGAATFVCLLVLNAIFHPFKNRLLNKIIIILGIGYLPWFHQRFIPLSLGLFLAFILYRKERKIPFREILVISLFLFILSLPYFYYFYSITGNPSPLSTSEFFGKTFARTMLVPLGFVGYFFAASRGFLWFYPWIILFFFGVYWGCKQDPQVARALFIIFLPYYLMCSAAMPFEVVMPPGRYLLPVFPVFLVFCGITLRDFFKNFSYPKVLFYLIYFFLIFLNLKIWFIRFDFGNYITPDRLLSVIKSILIVFVLYLSVFFAEKYLFPKDGSDMSNIILIHDPL